MACKPCAEKRQQLKQAAKEMDVPEVAKILVASFKIISSKWKSKDD